MYSESFCAAVDGIDGCIIQIEADISDGLPGFSMVGYLSSEVKEARERVRISLKNAGFRFPPQKVTVNLSPADIRKEGTSYDLAIAVAVLAAGGFIPDAVLSKILFIGELMLNGQIKSVQGVLPMVYTASQHGLQYVILPAGNFAEGNIVENIIVKGVSTLQEVVSLLQNDTLPAEKQTENRTCLDDSSESVIPDFEDVNGQEMVCRAAEVAAAGMHNFLMIGPPGSGKTMIAKRMAGILPEMSFDEQMEISKVYSVAGLLSEKTPLILKRPFRAPHHTITQTALVGGGRFPTPGEISLSSGGVLFLDELPEFARSSIEVLRQPLEDGSVTVTRLSGSCRYPAKMLLLAAMNPCPCGYFPDKRCRCSPIQIQHYLGKISQPILDRMDVCTETIPLQYQEMKNHHLQSNESSAQIRERVEKAHKIQEDRYRLESFSLNSQLTPKTIEKYCILTPAAEQYLKKMFSSMSFSARAYHKILKVALTIADLEGTEQIEQSHIAEAVCYRSIDRKYWNGGY